VSAGLRWALEVAVAWVAPWRAVRRIRGQEHAIVHLADALVAVSRQKSQGKRHLYLASRTAGDLEALQRGGLGALLKRLLRRQVRRKTRGWL
jgi:hypothetical protein